MGKKTGRAHQFIGLRYPTHTHTPPLRPSFNPSSTNSLITLDIIHHPASTTLSKMSHSVSPPPIRKPAIPPLMRESFTRLPKRLSHQPSFAKNTPPFKTSRLPQLPPLYDFILAAVITSEPEPEDVYGLDTQTWDEEKHTLASLAMRGRKYFESKVLEKVQDLAPGPFKDLKAIQVGSRSLRVGGS